MAIKVGITTVIDNSRNIVNVGDFGDSNTVYYGDGSNLSGVGVANSFVATGTIDNGDTVVLNVDGTVGALKPTDIGSEVEFTTTEANYISSVYDSANDKLVIVYRDVGNSDYGTAIVGTVSGTSISFGTPVVFESASTAEISCTYDSSNSKVVIAYSDGGNSDRATAIVGTVSGTSISFGTPVVFASLTADYTSTVYDPSNQKVVVFYRQQATGAGNGYAKVGTVSGTSISFGSAAAFSNNTYRYFSSTFDSTNNKVVIAYPSSSEFGTAEVGTVSGTSISFGSPTTFSSEITTLISTVFDSTNGKVVIAYRDDGVVFGESGFGRAIVGTVSGNSISFGSAVKFTGKTGSSDQGDDTIDVSATYDYITGKVVIISSETASSFFVTTLVLGTVSDTDIDFGSGFFADSISNSDYNPSRWLSVTSTRGRVVLSYRDEPSFTIPSESVSIVITPVNTLTSENYIGIAAEAISHGATGNITTSGGFNSSQTGLTAARTYYVRNSGFLALTADDPSVVAGTSISDTEILVR